MWSKLNIHEDIMQYMNLITSQYIHKYIQYMNLITSQYILQFIKMKCLLIPLNDLVINGSTVFCANLK